MRIDNRKELLVYVRFNSGAYFRTHHCLSISLRADHIKIRYYSFEKVLPTVHTLNVKYSQMKYYLVSVSKEVSDYEGFVESIN